MTRTNPSARAQLLVATLVVAITLLACEGRPRDPARSVPTTRSQAVAAASIEPLDYIERCPPSGCGTRLPLLVAIHGLGDTPENFAAVYEGLRTPVRTLVLRAPLPWGDGRAWFPYRSRNTPPETLVAPLLELVPRVLATIDHACSAHPCDGRVIVSGFSQGGMLTYTLTARAPERFVAMVPISGFLVPGIEPLPAQGLPHVVAFHGDGDGVIPPAWDEQGVARLVQAGFEVDFHLVPGVGHSIPPAERAEVLAAIDSALTPQ